MSRQSPPRGAILGSQGQAPNAQTMFRYEIMVGGEGFVHAESWETNQCELNILLLRTELA